MLCRRMALLSIARNIYTITKPTKKCLHIILPLQNKLFKYKNLLYIPSRFINTNIKDIQDLLLPALSPTMEAGSIVKWHKSIGDKIEPGDIICDIETDKASVGFEAIESSYLAAILVKENISVNIGTRIGFLCSKSDSIPSISEYTKELLDGKSIENTSSNDSSNDVSKSSNIFHKNESFKTYHHTIEFPPSVNILLHKHNIDPSSIKPTGPKGRLTKGDVLEAIETGEARKVSSTENLNTTTDTPKSSLHTPSSTPSPSPSPSSPVLKQKKDTAIATDSCNFPGLTGRQNSKRYFVDIPIDHFRTNIDQTLESEFC